MDEQTRWNQLTSAISYRASQEQIAWAMFGTLGATNAILLVALFSSGDLPQNGKVGIVVSAVGVSVSILWNVMLHRIYRFAYRIEQLVTKIETDLEIDDRHSFGYIFPSHNLVGGSLLLIVVSILWLLGFIYFMVKL